jgi:hypothetical protein
MTSEKGKSEKRRSVGIYTAEKEKRMRCCKGDTDVPLLTHTHTHKPHGKHSICEAVQAVRLDPSRMSCSGQSVHNNSKGD